MASTLWAKITRQGKPPVLLRQRSSTALIMVTVLMALYTDLFPYAVVVPVMPFALKERAGAPHESVKGLWPRGGLHALTLSNPVQSWISISLATFGASILVFSPLWGFLADRYQNRRGPMLAGLILLAASTLLLMFMHNFAMMVAGRVLQGMTAALTWSVGLALVVDTVNSDKLGQVMGWVGVVTMWAELSAPLLGGIIFGKGGWYAVWAMCFGLIGADIVLRLVIIEKKHAKKWQAADEEQAATSYEGVSRTTSVTTVDEEKRGPEAENGGRGPDVAGEAVEAKIGVQNMVRMLKNSRFLAAIWGCIIESTIPTTFDSILPLEVEKLFGWGSLGAGLIFALFVGPIFLAPCFGWLSDKHGPKWYTALGFFFATPFLFCLRFVMENSWRQKVLLCGLLAGAGLGFSCTMSPLMAEITWSIRRDENMTDNEPGPIALAYAFYSAAFSAGTVLGPLLGGYVRDQAGWGTSCLILGALTLFTGATSIMWTGGPLLTRTRRVGDLEKVLGEEGSRGRE